MLSVDEYHQSKKRDRQVMSLEDFSESDLEAIQAPETPAEAAAYDHEQIE
jgi:hypothetical protein